MSPDTDNISTLWDTLTPKVYGYLIHTLKDPSVADDILQTTWLKAIEALPRFEHRKSGFSAWIFAIARNEMKMYWRKGGREVRYDESLHDHPEPSSTVEDKIFIDQILEKLSEEDRELIRLRYIADLSFSQISHILHINPIAVRVRMHRALVRARNEFRN